MSHTTPRLDDFIPSEPQQVRNRRLTAYRVTGNDRADFLQGQLSNDVTALQSGRAQLTSYSNPKGRVFSIMRLACIGDDWWLLLDADVADKVMQRLKMFVLRSDVQFEKDENFGSIVIAGHGAAETVASLTQRDENEGKLAILEVPGTLPRFEIFAAHDALPDPVTVADDNALLRWDTLSGLLQITSEQCEQHVAQMLNLDRLGAIHFRKGCYAGQEIIARMHYLGKLKKRALPVFAAGGKIDDEIFDADGKKIGTLLQSVAIEEGKLHLAMLNLSAIENELKLEDDSPVILLDTGLGHTRESFDATR
jgi:hypothetical protein